MRLGKPRRRADPEHQLQVEFTTWRRHPAILKRYPELRWAYAIPNGGKRSKATAGKLKAEGVEAGVFDYCLPVPAGGYAGLYLEFKAGKNTTTELQDAFREFAENQGYRCAVVWTLGAAIMIVESYLRGEGNE